jgi:hypothetical protein
MMRIEEEELREGGREGGGKKEGGRKGCVVEFITGPTWMPHRIWIKSPPRVRNDSVAAIASSAKSTRASPEMMRIIGYKKWA